MTAEPGEKQPRPAKLAGIVNTLRQFVYGMTGYEFSRHALELRHSLQTIFMVTTMGDMVGLPVMPPYYSLRLLPYVVPEIEGWKRRVLREREFHEDHEFDLHGV